MASSILAVSEGSGIYQIRNTLNGKRYIGSAKCFRVRWNGHRCRLGKNDHHSKHLQASWMKYGRDAFEFEIIEICEPSHLLTREQHWMDALRPEYNVCITAGNCLGRKHSDGTRQKIAEKAAGRKMPARSAEYRKRLSEIHAGKPKPAHVITALQAGRAARGCTDEQRAALSASLKKAYQEGRRSRKKSEDHKNKIGRFYAKLSDDQVREIRRLKLAGWLGKDLAVMFKSNTGTISEICNRKRYRWVSD